MRRRDIIFVCVAFGGLVAGLAWALSTQSRWVHENRPLGVQPPAAGVEGTGPAPARSTGVIGNVNDDTRTAMTKQMESRKPRGAAPMARPAPKKQARSAAKDEQGP